MNTLLSPPSLWLGGEYISSSIIGRKQFLKIMSHGLSLSGEEQDLLESVYTDTKKWFDGKMRRAGGRYFEHQKAVTLMGLIEFENDSFEEALARLSHDTPEDTYKGLRGVMANSGKQVSNIVGLVTNPEKSGNEERDALTKKAHYLSIRQFPTAGKVKVPDRTHNLRTHEVRLIADGIIPRTFLSSKVVDNARKQIDETLEYIMPIARSLGGNYETLLSREVSHLERSLRLVG